MRPGLICGSLVLVDEAAEDGPTPDPFLEAHISGFWADLRLRPACSGSRGRETAHYVIQIVELFAAVGADGRDSVGRDGRADCMLVPPGSWRFWRGLSGRLARSMRTSRRDLVQARQRTRLDCHPAMCGRADRHAGPVFVRQAAPMTAGRCRVSRRRPGWPSAGFRAPGRSRRWPVSVRWLCTPRSSGPAARCCTGTRRTWPCATRRCSPG